MANFNVEGAQNVEISKKLPCEKPLIVQLEIMERYTAVHKACAALPKEIREEECLKVLYPTLFRKITDQDLIAGRTDFLPIGFGFLRGCRALLRIQETPCLPATTG